MVFYLFFQSLQWRNENLPENLPKRNGIKFSTIWSSCPRIYTKIGIFLKTESNICSMWYRRFFFFSSDFGVGSWFRVLGVFIIGDLLCSSRWSWRWSLIELNFFLVLKTGRLSTTSTDVVGFFLFVLFLPFLFYVAFIFPLILHF